MCIPSMNFNFKADVIRLKGFVFQENRAFLFQYSKRTGVELRLISKLLEWLDIYLMSFEKNVHNNFDHSSHFDF